MLVRAQSGRDKRRWVEDGLSNIASLLFLHHRPPTNKTLPNMSSAAARKQQLEAAKAERERAAREAEEREAAELAEIERLEREEEEERRRVEEERRRVEEERRRVEEERKKQEEEAKAKAAAVQVAKEAALRERVHQQMLLTSQVRLEREAREREQRETNEAVGPSGTVDRSEYTERIEAEVCWRCRHNGRTCING